MEELGLAAGESRGKGRRERRRGPGTGWKAWETFPSSQGAQGFGEGTGKFTRLLSSCSRRACR